MKTDEHGLRRSAYFTVNVFRSRASETFRAVCLSTERSRDTSCTALCQETLLDWRQRRARSGAPYLAFVHLCPSMLMGG